MAGDGEIAQVDSNSGGRAVAHQGSSLSSSRSGHSSQYRTRSRATRLTTARRRATGRAAGEAKVITTTRPSATATATPILGPGFSLYLGAPLYYGSNDYGSYYPQAYATAPYATAPYATAPYATAPDASAPDATRRTAIRAPLRLEDENASAPGRRPRYRSRSGRRDSSRLPLDVRPADRRSTCDPPTRKEAPLARVAPRSPSRPGTRGRRRGVPGTRLEPRDPLPHEVRAENVVFHSRDPFAREARAVAEATRARVARSPFFDPSDEYHVYFCDNKGLFALFALWNHGRRRGVASRAHGTRLHAAVTHRAGPAPRPERERSRRRADAHVLHRARDHAHHGRAPARTGRLLPTRNMAAGGLRGLRREGREVRLRRGARGLSRGAEGTRSRGVRALPPLSPPHRVPPRSARSSPRGAPRRAARPGADRARAPRRGGSMERLERLHAARTKVWLRRAAIARSAMAPSANTTLPTRSVVALAPPTTGVWGKRVPGVGQRRAAARARGDAGRPSLLGLTTGRQR